LSPTLPPPSLSFSLSPSFSWSYTSSRPNLHHSSDVATRLVKLDRASACVGLCVCVCVCVCVLQGCGDPTQVLQFVSGVCGMHPQLLCRCLALKPCKVSD